MPSVVVGAAAATAAAAAAASSTAPLYVAIVAIFAGGAPRARRRARRAAAARAAAGSASAANQPADLEREPEQRAKSSSAAYTSPRALGRAARQSAGSSTSRARCPATRAASTRRPLHLERPPNVFAYVDRAHHELRADKRGERDEPVFAGLDGERAERADEREPLDEVGRPAARVVRAPALQELARVRPAHAGRACRARSMRVCARVRAARRRAGPRLPRARGARSTSSAPPDLAAQPPGGTSRARPPRARRSMRFAVDDDAGARSARRSRTTRPSRCTARRRPAVRARVGLVEFGHAREAKDRVRAAPPPAARPRPRARSRGGSRLGLDVVVDEEDPVASETSCPRCARPTRRPAISGAPRARPRGSKRSRRARAALPARARARRRGRRRRARRALLELVAHARGRVRRRRRRR